MPTFEVEVQCSVPCQSFWEALSHTTELFPKIAPHVMSNIEVIEGSDAEIGCIRQITFGSSFPEGSYVKEKLVSLDPSGMEATITEVEGGHLSEGFTEWTMTMRVNSTDEDACCMTISVDYEGGNDPQSSIARTQESLTALFKGVEQYIVNSAGYTT